MSAFAVEFDSQTKRFQRVKYPERVARAGEVLVEVVCCTICGSDLHTVDGRRSAPPNCVLGHEIIGRIVDPDGVLEVCGFDGQRLVHGQRVTWAMAVGCGQCFYCKHDLPQKCDNLFKYGHESGGAGIPTGGLSHFCVLVANTPIFVLPDDLPDAVACPANCATATVSAALRLARQTHRIENASVLITGAGMLGLTAAAMTADAGASRIIVADPNEERLSRTDRFGATHRIAGTDVVARCRGLTEDRGVDIAMDFAGVTAAVETCIASVRIGGCVMMVGSVFPAPPLTISPEQIVRRMLVLRGLHNYMPEDLEDALRFLHRVQATYPFADLIEKGFPLEETEAAFDAARQNHGVRVAVRPGSVSKIMID